MLEEGRGRAKSWPRRREPQEPQQRPAVHVAALHLPVGATQEVRGADMLRFMRMDKNKTFLPIHHLIKYQIASYCFFFTESLERDKAMESKLLKTALLP